MRSLMLTLALGVAACAETPRQTAARVSAEDRTRVKLDRELAGLLPGAPQSCLQTYERREMKAFGDTLVFGGNGRTRWVTQTTGCRDVGGNNILVTRTPTGQFCRGDIATTVDRTSGIQTGGCSYGDFIPYRRPAR